MAAVKQHLDTLHAAQGETRRRVEMELVQVETELGKLEDAIVQGGMQRPWSWPRGIDCQRCSAPASKSRPAA